MEKKLDKVGRFTIPKEFRYVMGLMPGDIVEIEMVDGKLVVEKKKEEE